MPIVSISRIQHRRGKRTDLPQLAAGELGWVIDEQRLFIGNGTVADGAPAVGNTEIVTAGSSAFTTALNHTYQGYLGDSTPVTTSQARTLGQRLDEYVSVKDFGAKGDDSTADVTAIQNAIDEVYTDTDKDDTRSRRVLFFPAGTYRINAALKIPPYAHLVGEGPDKTIIRNSGNNAVMVMQDDEGNVGGEHRKLKCYNTNTDTDFKHDFEEHSCLWRDIIGQGHEGLLQQRQVPRLIRIRWCRRIKFKRCDCY